MTHEIINTMPRSFLVKKNGKSDGRCVNSDVTQNTSLESVEDVDMERVDCADDNMEEIGQCKLN